MAIPDPTADETLVLTLNTPITAKFCLGLLRRGLTGKMANAAADQGMHIMYFLVAVLDLLADAATRPEHPCAEIPDVFALFDSMKPGIVEWVDQRWVNDSEEAGGFAFHPGGFADIPATHSGLLTLLICLGSLESLRQHLGPLRLAKIQHLLSSCQFRAPGSSLFAQAPGAVRTSTHELWSDARYLYSAAVVHALVGGGLDTGEAGSFLRSLRHPCGAYMLQPNSPEEHAGATFCATAAGEILGTKSDEEDEVETLEWLSRRVQGGGFCGRPCKKNCSCYFWWVGAPLARLSARHGVQALNAYEKVFTAGAVANCVSVATGGVGSEGGSIPDPLHTFTALYGLAAVLDRPNVLPKVNTLFGVLDKYVL